MQWEEISRTIEKNAKSYMKSTIQKEGEFSTEEVNVNWKILPRDSSYIAFEKLRFIYTLDWIMLVKITRILPLPDRPITPDVIDIISSQNLIPEYEPNNVNVKPEQQKSRYKASSIETSKDKKPPEYSPRPVSTEFEMRKTYTPSKIETDSETVPSSVSNSKQKMIDLFGSHSEDENREGKLDAVAASSDERSRDLKRTARKRQLFSGEPKAESRQKKVKKTKGDSDQSNLDTWIDRNATPSKFIDKKTSKGKSTTYKKNGSNPLDDDVTIEQMQSFLVQTRQYELDRVRRRDELENLVMWDCNDMTNEDLKR
jgi:hypothetical protein